MRILAPLLAAALFAFPSTLAQGDGHIETRRYQSLWPAEEVGYLAVEMAEGALVCEPSPGLNRSLGGVCFDVRPGETSMLIWAHSALLVFTPPTLVLWFRDDAHQVLGTMWTCAPRPRFALPEGTTEVVALAIDGAPGCPTGPAVWGSITASFS